MTKKIKKSNKPKKKKNSIPNWIHQKENCFYCNKSSSLDFVDVPEDNKSVLMHYKCQNDECTYPLSGSYEFGFKVVGEWYVEEYKKFVDGTKNKSNLGW